MQGAPAKTKPAGKQQVKMLQRAAAKSRTAQDEAAVILQQAVAKLPWGTISL
ncbi:MAG: hypothetical protein IPP46_17945 [Bacteroidetes bacterium]|nr:hypothetical protein [Bacteroidota bacterium]